MKFLFTCLLSLAMHLSYAQELGFKFGVFGLNDLSLKSFPLDTAARAMVLDEFGMAYIDNYTGKMLMDYHVRIRILKSAGQNEGDFSIPVRKNGSDLEIIRDLVGSTFNLNGASREEVKLDARKIFTENVNQYYDLKKFTLPNVRVGSVLEVMYTLESPFLFNLYPWEFQDDIPKLHSEFWAKIPGNYTYNTVLKGPLKLSKNESSIVTACFEMGSNKADCALFKYAIIDIPAFKEEKYMTAKSNFLSALNFELLEVKHFDGRVQKFTAEWKDVDFELKQDGEFGAQIKKAGNIWEDEIKGVIAGESDQLKQAKLIYHYVANYFTWNEITSKYSKEGVKKAFETKRGNSGDINLSLVGALQSANLKAEPVILSTRANGLPILVHPVITDFNYVVAAVDIGGQMYLLDATEKYNPFGLIPERCLNGVGRIVSKEPDWIELKPQEKRKETIVMNLELDSAGVFHGTMSANYNGYLAVNKREAIHAAGGPEGYLTKLKGEWQGREISEYKLSNLENVDAVLIEQMNITIRETADMNAQTLYLDPFFAGKTGENPFKSDTRSFPVDFGSPIERTLIVNITHPAKFKLEEQPPAVTMGLPRGTGRFLFNVGVMGNKVNVSSNMVILKSVYPSEDYTAIRELFTKIIQTEQTTLVFSSKK